MTVCTMPKAPFRLEMSSWLSILYIYLLPRSPKQCASPLPALPARTVRNTPQLMLPRLLYGLEKAYFDGLNKLLRTDNYVKQLVEHPENEMSELVDYLNDVCLRSTK